MEPQANVPNPQNPNDPTTNPSMPQPAPVAEPQAVPPTPTAVVSGPLPGERPQAAPSPQFVSNSQLSQKSKGSKRLVTIIISVILVLGLGAAGARLYMANRPTPQKVFDGSLSTLLSTKSVTQKASSGDTSGTLLYDLNDIKQPKDSFTAEVTMSGIKFNLDGYGSMQNVYINFRKIGVEGTNTPDIPVLNKWIQLRKQGTLDPGVDPSLVQLADPRSVALGQIIFGNFSAGDSKDLLASAKQQPFFKFDPKNVKKETLDGHKVFVYQVTIDKKVLGEYNKKVAKIMGLPDADGEAAAQNVQDGPSEATLYIRTDNKQVVKVASKGDDGNPITNVYTDYNNTNLPGEPKGEITYEQFQQGLVKGLTQ